MCSLAWCISEARSQIITIVRAVGKEQKSLTPSPPPLPDCIRHLRSSELESCDPGQEEDMCLDLQAEREDREGGWEAQSSRVLKAAPAQSQGRAWLLVMLTFLDSQPSSKAEHTFLPPIQPGLPSTPTATPRKQLNHPARRTTESLETEQIRKQRHRQLRPTSQSDCRGPQACSPHGNWGSIERRYVGHGARTVTFSLERVSAPLWWETAAGSPPPSHWRPHHTAPIITDVSSLVGVTDRSPRLC